MSIAEIPHQEPEFERVPPHDLNAEQCVLGGMMLAQDAISDVVEQLRSSDFYRPAHQVIYDVILDLYGRGEPADAVMVGAELTKRGEHTRTGGAPYLFTLINSVPTAANAGYYAKIVQERSVLRRLVEAGTRIVQLGYAANADADDLLDQAQAEVYAIADKRSGEDYLPLSEIMPFALDEIEAIGSRDGQMTGVPTGFTDLDGLTNGLHGGQMIVVAARPAMGKSTLALDFVRAASIKHGLTSAFFSLEMGRNEITMRLLSAEARVALHAMRSGTMNDDDWTRLARRMSEVAEAPLFIDDSPNMSMMEIRAKCRRLKQQHDLRLVVIDYLQLMTSGKRVESRQVEVSEFSRSLKLLAKELQVPVIALSQLNRGPEQRTDKRPMVSDLRESGCVTASTRLMRADDNEEVTIGELFAGGARDIPVWALDERLKYVPRTLTHAFSSGRKEAFRVTLASGRQVEATANHPFLTYGGWKDLGSLAVGTKVAAARHVPPPLVITPMDDDEVAVSAHLIGGGSFVAGRPVRHSSEDEACLDAVSAAAGSAEKFVPHPVFALPKKQVALFLRHLWATDGSVRWDEKNGRCEVHYSSAGRRLVEDVARLLLRFGIMSRIETVRKPGDGPRYRLHLCTEPDQLAFLDAVGVHGARGEVAKEASARLREKAANATNTTNAPNTGRDAVPGGVWDGVGEILVAEEAGHRPSDGGFRGGVGEGNAPGRQRLDRVASLLESTELELMATNDVCWEEIASIESLGVQDVYDATVMGLSNFIANGVALHNSIEQDADMVILLHREDAYEKESPRAGEADLIVAKHRNGPTATVTVAFQGHYSRFVDMATG